MTCSDLGRNYFWCVTVDGPASFRFSSNFKVVFVPFQRFLLFYAVGVECSPGGAIEGFPCRMDYVGLGLGLGSEGTCVSFS